MSECDLCQKKPEILSIAEPLFQQQQRRGNFSFPARSVNSRRIPAYSPPRKIGKN
jgi:hypothetical protein